MSEFTSSDQHLQNQLTYKAAISLDNFLGYTYKEGMNFDAFLNKSSDKEQLLKLLQSQDFLKLMGIDEK